MIIGNPIMAGASGSAASIFVTGLSETDTVTAVHKKTVQVPNPDYIGLPDGYTQLEYIQSTGTQYIDIGYSTENASKLQKMSFEITCAYYDIETGSTAELLNGNGNAYLGYINGMFYAAWGRKGGILTNNTIVPNNQMHTWSVDTTAREFWFDDILVESNAVFDGSANSYGLLYLFGDSPTKLNNCRIAHAAIKYNDEFVRNFIPCRRNSDGTLGMYDTVNNVFYTNAGTGAFTAGSEIPAYIEMTVDDKTLTGKWTQKPNPAAHGLPDGYTELEYIESTGTQYIIPNINIVNGLYTKCVFRPTDLNTDNHVLSSRTSTGFLFAAWQQETKGVGLGFGSSDSKNTFTSYSSSDVVITQETTILSNTAKSSFNGTEFASIEGTASNVNSASLYLFCMNDSGTTRYFAKVKLYELFASVNGVPTHDFIPAKRNSDGAIGLYDLVSNTFFENAGTGDFAAGSEVPQTFDGHMLSPIREFGTWTVTATDGTNTATQDVLVDVITEYEIEITKKLYLYRDGDECEDITGGWSNSGYSDTGYTITSPTKNADNLYFSAYLQGIGTNNAIDFTGYTKLCAEMMAITSSVTHPWLGHLNAKSFDDSGRVNAGCSKQNVKEIVTIDISTVTVSRYVYFGQTNTTGGGYVYNAWLE